MQFSGSESQISWHTFNWKGINNFDTDSAELSFLGVWFKEYFHFEYMLRVLPFDTSNVQIVFLCAASVTSWYDCI